jgi:hypothetical protein
MEGLHQKYRQDHERVQGMDKVLQPYGQFFQVNGGAQQTIQNLLQTGATLQMGAPGQKAQVVAQIIKEFGVDIKALDSLLAGGGLPPDQQKQSELDQMLNERLAPLQQQLQTYQQREQMLQEQEQQKINSELNAFAQSHEFYHNVKSDMADIMDMAAKRGREMSLEEAYNVACNAHPEIAKIMQNRTAQTQVERKRRAASSVSGSPAGTTVSEAPDSRLAALNAAWDNYGRT